MATTYTEGNVQDEAAPAVQEPVTDNTPAATPSARAPKPAKVTPPVKTARNARTAKERPKGKK